MYLYLLAWILAACAFLAPGRNVEGLSKALAKRIDTEAPLFKDDNDKLRTAALMVSVAFREGSLQADIKGDKNKQGQFTSFCTFQVHVPPGTKTVEGWTGEELAADPEKCVAAALRLMRESVRMCPKHPVAFYAEGKTIETCDSQRAQRISNDRMALARRLIKETKVESDGATAKAKSAP